MNKKKETKPSRGRKGGRGRQRSVPCNLTRTSTPLQERDLQTNIFVDDNTSAKKPAKKAVSKRGRPKSRTVEIPPMTMPPMSMPPMNIYTYVPVKQLEHQFMLQRHVDTCQIAPVLPTRRRRPRPAILSKSVQPVRFRAQSMTIQVNDERLDVPKPSSHQESQNNNHGDNNNNNDVKWPEELEELVAEWDNLPSGHLWEVIEWMKAPVVPIEPRVPYMVANIQEMMAEWEETHENKVNQVLEWLGYGDISREPSDSNGARAEPVERPKVVVEKEFTSVQCCSHWSSMNEHNERSSH